MGIGDWGLGVGGLGLRTWDKDPPTTNKNPQTITNP